MSPTWYDTNKHAIIAMRPLPPSSDARAPKTFAPVRAPEPQDELADIRPPDLTTLTPQPVVEKLAGDYRSRAVGFSIKTWQLSLVFGIAMWLLARLAVGAPLFSIKGVIALVMGFAIVWGAAFALDLLLSPAGVAWYNSRRFWNHLDQEQRERHRRYQEAQRHERG